MAVWVVRAVSEIRQRRPARVFEIGAVVCGHIAVGDVTEIDPAMGILVHEEGRKRYVGLPIVRRPGVSTCPIGPGRGGKGIARRPEPETINDHRFVVTSPITSKKITRAGIPPH